MDENQLLADQPLGQKLIKKGFWLYFFMVLTAPVSYLIKVLISNTLSVEDIGIFYSVLGLITLISAYNDLGLTEALQYFLPKYRLNKEYGHYKTVLYLTFAAQLLSGIIIALGLWFGADWLAIHHFHSPEAAGVVKTLCRYFIGINFLQAFQSVFVSFQDVSSNNISTAANMYSTLLFTVIFWLMQGLTLASFSSSWIFGVGIGVIVSTIVFVWKYKKTLRLGSFALDKQVLSRQFSYAFWVFLGGNVASLLGQLDQQLVVNFLGAKEAGYYTNFFTLFAAYNIVMSPLLGLLFPIVTELQTKQDMPRLSILQNIFYKYFSVFALSIAGLFVAFGPQISSILFGVKFYYSGHLLQYLAPSLVFNILLSINFGILAGIGKAKERVSVLAWGLLVNVLVNVIGIFVLKIGLLAPVFALAAGWLVVFWRGYRLVHRNCPISFNWKYFLSNALFIGVLVVGLIYVVVPRFVLDDGVRYVNLCWLLLCFCGYYLLIVGFNWKSLRLLWRELSSLRKRT